jgi:plastocyanin
MRRIGQTLLVAALLALGVAGGAFACSGTDSADGTSAATASSAVQASGSEFRINLSRSKVEPSKLRLEFVNYGEDDHDLAVRRVGTTLVRNLGTTKPGERSVERFKVRKGTYLMWCTLADHRARGMKATLKVRTSS